MIFFDWKKLVREANHSAYQIIEIMDMLVFERPPRRGSLVYKYHKKGINIQGDSFLINPKNLLIYGLQETTRVKMVEYIKVASFRNYVNYSNYKQSTLPTRHYLGKVELLHYNPLLLVKDGLIHFKYEKEI